MCKQGPPLFIKLCVRGPPSLGCTLALLEEARAHVGCRAGDHVQALSETCGEISQTINIQQYVQHCIWTSLLTCSLVLEVQRAGPIKSVEQACALAGPHNHQRSAA